MRRSGTILLTLVPVPSGDLVSQSRSRTRTMAGSGRLDAVISLSVSRAGRLGSAARVSIDTRAAR
ncbi:hypothetical protein J6590_020613 [Homalodisca vitripennis]|nr:hypothetical protein J6590_020613 [Homalodisca vitripennis]